MPSIGVLWSQYGPYHFARVTALKSYAQSQTIHALEMASRTTDYQWSRSGAAVNLITLFPGDVAESLPFWKVFLRTRRSFAKLKLNVCFLPSYSPKQSLAALLAARSLGIRTVMMTESHMGTRRSRMVGTWFKRRLVGLFDSALVGGNPQKSYVKSLGLSEQNIFIGYDVVDNDYFSRRANEIRSQATEIREKYQLPQRYILNLGRFVEKKNLTTLIRAYRRLVDQKGGIHLVLVGSGQEESNLRRLCEDLRLPIYDKMAAKGDSKEPPLPAAAAPGVHFYGFRQIEDNPVFYALADAFILPSSWEEWGLVVNEAMSCGLPVVVSETAGCSEDLLRRGEPPSMGNRRRWAAALADRVRQNGFVFDPGSVESLTEVLLALDSDPELRQAMGRASQSIIDDFSCEKFARNALLAAQAAMGSPPYQRL
jgi:1,2-diacylglycerol 3-alpha-glucosyltransferase